MASNVTANDIETLSRINAQGGVDQLDLHNGRGAYVRKTTVRRLLDAGLVEYGPPKFGCQYQAVYVSGKGNAALVGRS